MRTSAEAIIVSRGFTKEKGSDARSLVYGNLWGMLSGKAKAGCNRATSGLYRCGPSARILYWVILWTGMSCYTVEGGLLRWYCCSVCRFRSSRSRWAAILLFACIICSASLEPRDDWWRCEA